MLRMLNFVQFHSVGAEIYVSQKIQWITIFHNDTHVYKKGPFDIIEYNRLWDFSYFGQVFCGNFFRVFHLPFRTFRIEMSHDMRLCVRGFHTKFIDSWLGFLCLCVWAFTLMVNWVCLINFSFLDWVMKI